MNLEEFFLSIIKKYNLLSNNDRILVSFSGGADSVFLTEMLLKLIPVYNISISLFHLNHNIRKDEAIRDELFAKNYAEKKGLRIFISSIDVINYSKSNKLSIEEAGRIVRHNEIDRIMKENNFNKCFTGHNLNDLTETMLFRIFKGTGIEGLAGIKIINNYYYRPMLFISKEDIIDYNKKNNLEWVEDSSNQDNKYERNYIRNRIIPVIKDKFTELYKKSLELWKIANIENNYWEGIIQNEIKNIKTDNDRITIPKDYLKTLHNAIFNRLLRHLVKNLSDNNTYLNLNDIEIIENSLDNNCGNKILYNDKYIRILSAYNEIIIEKPKKFQNSIKYVKINDINNDYDIEFNNYRFFLSKILDNNIEKDKKKSVLINIKDCKDIILRPKKDGDYIFIKDMKKKKLKNIFIDDKINLSERENTIVFCNDKEEILLFYVPEKRFYISEKFRLDGRDKLYIEYKGRVL